MYDPLIVDTFAKVHKAIEPQRTESVKSSQAFDEIASARKNASVLSGGFGLEEITSSADEMLTLYDLARGLAGNVSLGDAGDLIAKHLRRLIPASLCVVFLYDQVNDDLEAKYAVGEGMSLVRGMRITLGQRLSGWVAANRQTISNSDPVLDLGDVARSSRLKLRSCISTPLLHDNQLVGVLTLYSSDANAFSDDHRRIIEVIARQVAQTFKDATEFDRAPRRDSLTGLPHFSQLEQLMHTDAHEANETSYALLFIDVIGLKGINVEHSRAAGDEVVRQVVRHARRGLRVADILFRNTNDEFVALLYAADSETAELVASRIRTQIHEERVHLSDGVSLTIEATVTVVCAPRDGESLLDLLTAAKTRSVGPQGPNIH
jgi:diguanylate cyclase (GGDEF)-like protein